MSILTTLKLKTDTIQRASALTRTAALMTLAGALLLMAACTALPAETPATSPDSPSITDETQQALVAQATADLAAELGVDADEIQVTSIEAVEWGDSSLGCPEEGMMYAAVITPGYRITLTHDGVDYVYHTGVDADGPMIPCTADAATSDPETGAEPPADSTQEELVNLAKADLASQLGVDADTIEVTAVEAVDWSDSSLGCPEEGMMYAQVITPGYQVTLTYDGVDYVYHTGADADSPMIPCTADAETSDLETGAEPPAGSTEEVLVNLAKADLASQLGADAEAIEVTAVEAVEWSDSSLGCPQPDMMYGQVITPGYRITLTHDGQEYVYHTGADVDSPVINCTDGQTDAAGDTEEPAPMLTTRETLIARAIDDLATRQGIAHSEIVVKSAHGVEWRDGSLGCAKAGMMYPQVITPGYRIILTADGADFAYHTSGRKDGPVKYCQNAGKSNRDDGTYRTE